MLQFEAAAAAAPPAAEQQVEAVKLDAQQSETWCQGQHALAVVASPRGVFGTA